VVSEKDALIATLQKRNEQLERDMPSPSKLITRRAARQRNKFKSQLVFAESEHVAWKTRADVRESELKEQLEETESMLTYAESAVETRDWELEQMVDELEDSNKQQAQTKQNKRGRDESEPEPSWSPPKKVKKNKPHGWRMEAYALKTMV
jgi:hypothetical protein